MSFYYFRFPSRRMCVLGLLGSGTAVASYEAWGVMRARRSTVPLFNSAAVVHTEESARYPCERLHGFDVVVRGYYVPVDSKSETDSPGGSNSGSVSTILMAASSLSSRFRRLVSLFSNSTHKVSVDSTVPAQCDDAASSVRLVVRDAKDAAALSKRGAGSDASLIAASHWPPHTTKYAALVLEPSARNATSLSRSLLRQLADGATHQSLVRCNPRSTLLDMACEGDPAYLGAPYLRVLLSGFCLLPSTISQLNVAVLGVGGGSLPLFLQTYFAGRLHRCDLVDVEPMCFKAAVEQLGLKEELNTVALRRDGGGVHYYVEDAVRYLQQRVRDSGGVGAGAGGNETGRRSADTSSLVSADTGSAPSFLRAGVNASTPVLDAPCTIIEKTATSTPTTTSPFLPSTSSRRQQQLDLLFVDLFVGSELDAVVTSIDFLQLCRGALSPYGVAAFNLPAADKAFVRRCAVVFGGHNVFRIPVPLSSNEVVLVRGGAESRSDMIGPELSHRHLYRRARELTAQYHLPYDLANHYPLWWRLW